LAKDYSYFSAKLSPDAKHIAIGLISEGERRLGVIDAKTFQVVGGADFSAPEEVGEFHWVTNKRLVIKVLQKQPWESEALYYGELFAIDLDGKRKKIIYGYRAGERQTGSNLKKNSSVLGWAEIVNYLPNDEKNILISSTPQSTSGGNKPTIHKLNVKTGKLGSVIARSPVAYADFLTDRQGHLRLAVGLDNENYKRVYRYDDQAEDWTEVASDHFGSSFTPLAIDDAGEKLFFIDNNNQDKAGIFSLNLSTGKSNEIYTDEEVDITDVVFSSDGNNVYAARVDPDYPTYVMFNGKSEEAEIYKGLLATFKGYKVRITSSSEDGNTMIIHVSNELSPNNFYLYNRINNQLSLLFSDFKHINEKLLSTSKPVSFKASDGQEIPGYLTRPSFLDDSAKPPLVVLVHGGPISRDYWEFDREVQLLASKGYAVLRVNFRGSSGYGRNFVRAGYEEWGDRIQLDIIDGAKWAASQDNISDDKVCIMGASFGGYSAVQSATMAPDLFKCVVANAGVYDLELMFKNGDVKDLLWGKSFLEQVLGTDIEVIRKFSPVNNVESLNAPILIAHGKKDRRVPINHANALKKKLDKLDKHYEWFVKSSETHGFHDEKNRAEYYQKVSEFLAKHLK
jgi:dipeptidyl aminopeptidase/acylaminoacyl peptidase